MLAAPEDPAAATGPVPGGGRVDGPGQPAVPDRAGVPAAARLRRGELTKARLLQACRVAFHGVPWSRVRVEDVCQIAGVGHGTFYAYYANKAAILEALVRRHAAALYRLVEAPWSGAGSGPDVRAEVHRVIAGFVELFEADRDIREIWLAAAPSEPVLAALDEEVRAQFIARIRSNLVAATDAGLARAGIDVEVAAVALAGLVEQSVQRLPAAVRADRLVDGLTDLWVHAVYVRPSGAEAAGWTRRG